MGAKKSIEEVKAKALERGFTLLSDTYPNCQAKLLWKCPKGHIIEMKSYLIISVGHGCLECSGLKRLTIEELKTKALQNGFKLISGDYINNRSVLTWECPSGHVFNKSFHGLRGCLKCSGLETLNIEHVRTVGLEKGFELLSDTYTNSQGKLQWKCIKRGHITTKKFADVVQNRGCLSCKLFESTLTLEEVRERGLERGFTLLSDVYTDNKTELQWRCEEGHTFWKKFSSVHSKNGCLECSGLKRLTIEEVRARALEKGFILLSETYTNAMESMEWRCKAGHSMKKNFNRIAQGNGCLICSQKYDKAQSELYQYVLGMYPDALYNKPNILKNKKFRLDIYIPSLKKAIELDGEYWHSKPEAIERDSRKNQECQDAGIELLRLGYLEHWHKKQETVGKPMVLKFLTNK